MGKNERINPSTGELDYYFPMEITDPSIKEYARFCGFEIDWARLGYRSFLAVFVPCKNKVIDPDGTETFIPTPSEVQHARYLEYIKSEMKEQGAAKQDGRCQIPDAHGGVKRCSPRVRNPDFAPGNGQPVTLPVHCEGCKYESFRQEHTFIPLSCFEHKDSEEIPYEVPSPVGYLQGDRYLELSDSFVAFIKERAPKLEQLASLRVDGLNSSEAARELRQPASTVISRMEKLRTLAKEFLDNVVTL